MRHVQAFSSRAILLDQAEANWHDLETLACHSPQQRHSKRWSGVDSVVAGGRGGNSMYC